MKHPMKLITFCALSVLFIAACTFGDKGEEGRTDSAVVDTSVHTNPAGGSTGTGIDQDTPIHSKESSILKDTMGTDSARRSNKP
ncbi:hypothetical protein [Pedobacter immunditicola]|uniref:hypothetical protein n=1 Tax=Pedobacter immunditicola TaxID=3133440 RepID=UPI0030AED11B